jgi:hypothetical protein
MGLACEIKYNSGTVYKGGMCKGERHGRGVEVFSDGERTCRFEGEWVKDKRHGRGLLLNATSSLTRSLTR